MIQDILLFRWRLCSAKWFFIPWPWHYLAPFYVSTAVCIVIRAHSIQPRNRSLVRQCLNIHETPFELWRAFNLHQEYWLRESNTCSCDEADSISLIRRIAGRNDLARDRMVTRLTQVIADRESWEEIEEVRPVRVISGCERWLIIKCTVLDTITEVTQGSKFWNPYMLAQSLVGIWFAGAHQPWTVGIRIKLSHSADKYSASLFRVHGALPTTRVHPTSPRRDRVVLSKQFCNHQCPSPTRWIPEGDCSFQPSRSSYV